MDSIIQLVARGLRNHDNDDDNSKKVCPVADESGPTIVPLVGSMTFHQFAILLAGIASLISVVVSLFNAFKHATNYTVPMEQRQIIRIILLIPWFSIISFLAVWQAEAAEYFKEALEVGESLALSAFLLLLCDFIISGEGGLDKLFNGTSAKDNKTPNRVWLKRAWYGVLQFIPISIIIWIATALSTANGTYCATSNSPHFAKIWITVIKFISTAVAIVAILRFYAHMKPELAPYKVFLKLFSFKTVVGLTVIQNFIINLLTSNNAIHTTKYLSYDDITVVIPMLITNLEMPFFALLLLYAYRCEPYRHRSSPSYGGPLGAKAIFQALLVTDIMSALIRGPMRLTRDQQQAMVAPREESVALRKQQSDESIRRSGREGEQRPHRKGEGVYDEEAQAQTMYNGASMVQVPEYARQHGNGYDRVAQGDAPPNYEGLNRY